MVLFNATVTLFLLVQLVPLCMHWMLQLPFSKAEQGLKTRIEKVFRA